MLWPLGALVPLLLTGVIFLPTLLALLRNWFQSFLQSGYSFKSSGSLVGGVMTKSKLAGGAGAAVIAMAAAFIAPWEGNRNYAYLDVAGIPTICYGSTRGVKMGDYKTDAECEALFKKEVGEFYTAMDKCLSNKATPVSVQASLLELGYNVGSSGLCGSTAMRKANAGDYKGACEAVTMWVKARVNGQLRVVKGLVNRRNASETMCMRDL